MASQPSVRPCVFPATTRLPSKLSSDQMGAERPAGVVPFGLMQADSLNHILHGFVLFKLEFSFWFSYRRVVHPTGSAWAGLLEVFPSRATPMAQEQTGSASHRY
jgi:hypothetical protein